MLTAQGSRVWILDAPCGTAAFAVFLDGDQMLPYFRQLNPGDLGICTAEPPGFKEGELAEVPSLGRTNCVLPAAYFSDTNCFLYQYGQTHCMETPTSQCLHFLCSSLFFNKG